MRATPTLIPNTWANVFSDRATLGSASSPRVPAMNANDTNGGACGSEANARRARPRIVDRSLSLATSCVWWVLSVSLKS